MKFREIARFEVAYQLRRPWTWLFFIALVVFAFLLTRDGMLAEALQDEFFVNSPFGVAKTTVTCTLIWLLMTAVVAGEAAARDVSTRMYPLLWTCRISKREYLGGRFVAALLVNALLLLAVQGGVLLAVYAPGIDPVLIGPFRPAAYLMAYGFLALPNAFAATAIQFLLASRSGRPMSSYLGSVLLFFMSFVAGMFLLLQGRQHLARLVDLVGVHFILSDLSHLWTTAEKSTRLIALEGTVLTNRLLWLGIGFTAIAMTYAQFRFAHRSEKAPFLRLFRAPRRVARKAGQFQETPAKQRARFPPVPRATGFALSARQTLTIAAASFRTIVWSWAGLAMLAGIPALTVLVVRDQMEMNGVPFVPATARVITELTGPISAEMSRWVIVPLLIVFFAGELVWREREAGAGEITDAMPGSEWAPLLGKFTGLGAVLTVFMALLMTAGVIAQSTMGHHDFQLGLYAKTLFGLQLPEYLLFAVLAIALHVVVNQKHIGHLVAIIASVFIGLASMFGIEHDLLIYGAGPSWQYTEMGGFGATVGPWLWFKLYWAAWALLLLVVARLLWVRGRESGSRLRLRLARRRMTRATALTGAVALALILGFGGFIFYNTNVLNDYVSAAENAERRAEYERRYGRYARAPQPRIAGTRLHVEIEPERREVDIRGSYELVNRGTAAIKSIHVATVRAAETDVALNRPAEFAQRDDELGHRIYVLEKPLQPGDRLRLTFRVQVKPRGFTENGIDPSVAANGTNFTTGQWLPAIGYQRSRELTSPAERREHGLPARPLIASLYDVEARRDREEKIAFEAIIGTDDDQVAVTGGVLRRTWKARSADGRARRYFHYASETPVTNEQYIFSARYALHEAQWQAASRNAATPVAIRIFHDPRHTRQLERMVQSIRASLDYFTGQFGQYPYSHVTFVEHPGDGDGAGIHAIPAMLIWEEGFAFWNPEDKPGSLDHPFAVIAHEMAHQWTVPYASVEGAPVLSEGVAWYYAMRAVEKSRGPAQLRLLLRFMRRPHPHPPIRRGEPLLRGLDPYMAYRRGPFALYALSEAIGEERVHTALRRLVEQHRPPEAPLATMLDLYRELQTVTPASFQPLLHDLFEVNTFWDFETERVTAKQTATGMWEVTLQVKARKSAFDEAGVETVLPMNAWVEIGVFGAAAEGHGALSAPLYVQKHRISAGTATIRVTVPRKPVLAGIDPYHLLDWVENEDDDNIEAVSGP
ncbi:MAG TPA: hypothetical protein VF846_08810 [Thermoanaerobaculia bacterium]